MVRETCVFGGKGYDSIPPSSEIPNEHIRATVVTNPEFSEETTFLTMHLHTTDRYPVPFPRASKKDYKRTNGSPIALEQTARLHGMARLKSTHTGAMGV